MDRFSSIGQRWSNEEEFMLMEEVKNNLSIDQIAKNHKRTRNGIICRMQLMSEKLLDKLNRFEYMDSVSKMKNENIGLKYTVRVLSDIIKSK